jgi:hypothetical protein
MRLVSEVVAQVDPPVHGSADAHPIETRFKGKQRKRLTHCLATTALLAATPTHMSML